MKSKNIPLFSVVLIGRNEEKTLPFRILWSLREFIKRGGDVVYLDTGSTDSSMEVAMKHGCETHSQIFDVYLSPKVVDAINGRFRVSCDPPIVSTEDRIFDFAEARNVASTFAKNDHILVAGCDEYFTTLDIDAINEFIRSGVNRMDIDYAHAHDAEGRKSICFRRGVFYNRLTGMWKGIVHEVVVSKDKVHFPSPAVISCEHYQEENANRNTYLPGLALDCFRSFQECNYEWECQNDRNLHYFGRELLYSGRYESAIRVLAMHLSLQKAWDQEQAQSRIFIGDCYNQLGRTESALQNWFNAFIRDGSRREPLIRIALHYYRKQDYRQAVAFAQASLILPNQGFYFNQTEYYADLPHWILYSSLWWLGDKQASKAHWEKARALAPANQTYKNDAVFYENL